MKWMTLLLSFVYVPLIISPDLCFSQVKKRVYTLQESITEAFANNWSFKAKKEKIDQAMQVKKQARAEFLPKFSMRYGYTRLDEVEKSDAIPLWGGLEIPERELNAKDNYQLKGTITQPVFTGFALTSAYELANLGIDQSEMDVDLEKIDLALRVKQAYFGILVADKAVEVGKDAVESLASQVKVARSFYNVGMIPINDVLKAEVELANAKQNLVKANNASRLARSAFNVVLSRPFSAPLDVEDVFGFTPERGEFQQYLDEALKNRPEMKLIDINILQTDQQIRLTKSKNYPEIALQFDYIKEGDEPDVSGSPFHDEDRWQAMAVLSWTFWEWGKTHYSIKENQSFRNELIKLKYALQDNIHLELRQAFLDLQTAEENIPATRKAVEQGEENLRVNQERYKAQVTTITEVLDAQTLLTQAKVNYYTALYNHHLAKAKLQRALGEY
jgi:outer membrane protein